MIMHQVLNEEGKGVIFRVAQERIATPGWR